MPDTSKKRIWWLASYPKSGNTWVRLFWAAYRQGRLDINDFFGSSVSDIARYYHHVVSPVPCIMLEPHEVALVRSAALLHMARQFKLEPLLMKTHSANLCIDRVPMIPPSITAGAIYIVRDPRDVAVSISRHNERSIDSAIDYMEDPKNMIGWSGQGLWHYLSDWPSHVQSWLKEKDFKVARMRYEDMVDRPAEKFAKMLDYLKVPMNKRRFERALSLTDFERLQKLEKRHGFVEANHGAFFNEGTHGNWSKHLTNTQAQRIEHMFFTTMKEMGYELSERKVEYLRSG